MITSVPGIFECQSRRVLIVPLKNLGSNSYIDRDLLPEGPTYGIYSFKEMKGRYARKKGSPAQHLYR